MRDALEEGAARCRVLLVDDEPNVLLGLRRTLRSLRARWDLLEAASGAEALEVLDSQHVDVLLCDLHMPDVDGRQVLAHAWEVQPTTVRILFSGAVQEDLVLASTGYAHQILIKPVQPPHLIARLERAAALRGRIAHAEVLRAVSRFCDLPVLPDLGARVERALHALPASAEEVSRELAGDPGMSLRLLRVANSALVDGQQEVTSTAAAVHLLGAELVRPLVLAADLFDGCAPPAPHVQELWTHSLQVAACAHALARHEGLDARRCELARLAGSLHEVGEIVLRSAFDAAYGGGGQRCGSRIPSCELERRAFGVTHADVGAYLLELWCMPELVVRAVSASHGGGEADGDPLSLLVRAADALVAQTRPVASAAHDLLDPTWLERSGHGPKLAAWRWICEDVLCGWAP